MLVLALLAGILAGLATLLYTSEWATPEEPVQFVLWLSGAVVAATAVAGFVYLPPRLAARRPRAIVPLPKPIRQLPCARCQSLRRDRLGVCLDCGLPARRYDRNRGRPRTVESSSLPWYVKGAALLPLLAVFGGAAFLATNEGLEAGGNGFPGIAYASPTSTATRTATPTETATATWTPTAIWTATRTASPTQSGTATETPTITRTPTITPTRTITPTATPATSPNPFGGLSILDPLSGTLPIRTPAPGPAVAPSLEIQVDGLRYGLMPDRARLIIDLRPGPSGAPTLPPYAVDRTETEAVMRLEQTRATPRTWNPDDGIIRSVQVESNPGQPTLVRITFAVPIEHIQGDLVRNPPRMSFDFFPR